MNNTTLQAPFKISGTGTHTPGRLITSQEIDQLAGYPQGTVENKTGVSKRFWADENETQADMGASAIRDALRDANYDISDIDCIVCASGTPHRPLPCTAACIQHALGESARGIPCFDINSTCLSFITALNLMAATIASGQHQRVVIVSAEKTSVGLNFRDVESAGLFGDGAVAFVVELDAAGSRGLLGHAMETDAKYSDICSIDGGGTELHAKYFTDLNSDHYLFRMDGPLLLKRILKTIKPFVLKVYANAGVVQSDIDWVVPHQASPRAMEIVRRFLGFPKERWINIVHEYGNCVAASIPMALHAARSDGRVRNGDTVLLLGTGAGIALAGAVIQL